MVSDKREKKGKAPRAHAQGERKEGRTEDRGFNPLQSGGS